MEVYVCDISLLEFHETKFYRAIRKRDDLFRLQEYQIINLTEKFAQLIYWI